MANILMDTAKKNKADEFYTQLNDIELELCHYKETFKDKVVFCNCDDPYESNFFKYFASNFNYLQLKKLICTCYDGSPIVGEQLSLTDLINQNDFKNNKTAYKIEITEVNDYNNDGAIDIYDVQHLIKNNKNTLTKLKDNGDFRSPECIELLKESDIVVTNPPFSLFREYISLLMKYNKLFLIIGNVNALSYHDIFPYIKENKLWLGQSIHSGDREFRVPDNYPLNASNSRIDSKGKKYIRVKGVRWFTNIDNKNRHEELTLYKHYNPDDYPTYENFNAINVDKTSDIPDDYNGYIGVPITFLDKYNPDQFEIIALGIVGNITFTSERKMEILKKDGTPSGKFTINAKGTLYRKWSSHLDKNNPAAFKDVNTGELYQSIYARIIIKKK